MFSRPSRTLEINVVRREPLLDLLLLVAGLLTNTPHQLLDIAAGFSDIIISQLTASAFHFAFELIELS